MSAKAHPKGEWWLKDISEIIEIERRSEVITVQAKKYGFWIIGADNFELKPDAIVIPDWETHKKYIRMREESNFDGGASSAELDGLIKSREWMSRHEKNGVPKFESVPEAVAFLESNN